MNILDKVIASVSPERGFERAKYRRAIAAYEAAKPSRTRKNIADNSSGTAAVSASGDALRGTARSLEQNYDVVKSALDILVSNTVGPNGISKEPRPKTLDGDIHVEFAKQLLEGWEDFSLKPDVTWQHDYPSFERLGARTLFRDGEALIQFVRGNVRGFDHGTRTPLSLELIEADHLPFIKTEPDSSIVNGVELNGWGRPVAYHLYESHPGSSRWHFSNKTNRIEAGRLIHPKLINRAGQVRGVTILHSVLNRIEDLKDYEESERVAARVAAALTGYIKKGVPDDYIAPEDPNEQREFKLSAGTIADNLSVGEEIGTVESNRPSSLLTPFHSQMMRSAAGGIGVGYSSLSKNYNGTYSAQRQELVEGWAAYQVLTNLVAHQISRPIWKAYVDMAVLSGQVNIPKGLDMRTLYDADYRGPPMPWIDPTKEIKANLMAEQALYKTGPQIIRERGGNPADVLNEELMWREMLNEAEIVSSAIVTEKEDEQEIRD